MEQINLPLAKIEHEKGEVKITSTLTGTIAILSAKQLQNWAVSQLRKELITPKAETQS